MRKAQDTSIQDPARLLGTCYRKTLTLCSENIELVEVILPIDVVIACSRSPAGWSRIARKTSPCVLSCASALSHLQVFDNLPIAPAHTLLGVWRQRPVAFGRSVRNSCVRTRGRSSAASVIPSASVNPARVTPCRCPAGPWALDEPVLAVLAPPAHPQVHQQGGGYGETRGAGNGERQHQR
jgi:hypothetical protein